MRVRKFLYKIETVICTDPIIDLQVRLNLLGEEGWEIISVIEPNFTKNDEYFILMIFLKKKK